MSEAIETPVASVVIEPSGKLAETGLSRAAQIAVEAMSEAHDTKQWAKCVEVGDAWIDAHGEMPALCCIWYAQSLQGVRRYEEAMQWAKVAVENIPASEPFALCAARSTYAQALSRLGLFHAARNVLKELVAVPIDEPEAMEKQGHTLLAISDKWKRGWQWQEARLRQEHRPFPRQCRPWDGVTKEPVAILHEQGIGDSVLAGRWAPWLEQASGHPVTWYGPELLHRWMSEACSVGNIDEAAKSDDEKICALYTMSLPHYSGINRPSEVPAPYAPPSLLAKRQHRRPQPGHIRVGVCWKGAAIGGHDFERSYSPDEFAPIFAKLLGVEFVNLCHDAPVTPSMPFGPAWFSDIYDTGETMTTLDLVVSVDTAVVHIAGSLGIPTLALVPTIPDWRYQWPNGGGTPFYPSVTVLRRKRADDFEIVEWARGMVERYAQALNRRIA